MGAALHEAVAIEIDVWLTRRRMQRKDLAEAIGWAPSQVTRRLSGRTQLSIDDLGLIAGALEVPIAVLLPAEERALDQEISQYSCIEVLAGQAVDSESPTTVSVAA